MTSMPDTDAIRGILEREMRLARQAGLTGGRKDTRISGRISRKLMKAVRDRTGLDSDSAIIEAALVNLAMADDFGVWLAGQAGRLDEDFTLEF